MEKTSDDYFAHPTVVVDSGADIGDGTKIWHWTHVSDGCSIGKNCVIGQNVYVAPGVLIGDGCKIQNNVSLYSGVVLERGVFIGPSVVFTNVINPRAFVERKDEFRITTVKIGASIGANATIICGNTIGPYALVGAGAVVTRDIQGHTCVVGNPANVLYKICFCGEKLVYREEELWLCNTCGKMYRCTEEGICEFNSST